MKLSLIVCTRNRAARLGPFLASIAALEDPPGGWELILVDSASTDSTSTVLDQFAREMPFPVLALRASQPGLSRARNAGLAKARGEIIAFTDDDCYPRADYLRALAEVFDEGRAAGSGGRHETIGFVGGRTVLKNPDDAKVGVKDVATPLDVPPRSFVVAGSIHGANMAVRREVVSAIGGFDPLLGAGAPCIAAEDTDFIARAAWAGWSGRYDPRIVVAHDHGRKPGPAANSQMHGYDYGRGAYYAKFLLERRSRRVYVHGWYYTIVHRPVRFARVGRILREVAGAARYLALRLARREVTPAIHLPDPTPVPCSSTAIRD